MGRKRWEFRLERKHIFFHLPIKEEEFDEILTYCDHIVFNSFEQLERFGKRAAEAGKSVGLRINPQYSTQEGHEIYDPCALDRGLG